MAETKLSIVLGLVDKATSKISAINKRLEAATKPIREFKEALGDLREKSGLDDVIGGFKGVGSAVAGVLAKVAMIGGVVGAAVIGLFKLVDGFDDLGDKAESAGVSVDFLAQMRYAAERSGAAVETLDKGMQGLSVGLGMARAGSGKLAGFLKLVSPALLEQLKATKSNEEAFGLLADAAAKIEDPAKRAAFAQKTLGDASLAPLLGKGAKGIKELRDRYHELAGSQEGAAGEASKVDDAMKDLKAATDGIKAALVEGLSPALKGVVDQLRDWFKENRGNVAEFAANLGKKLPGAIKSLVGAVGGIIDTIKPFVDSTTKLKVIAAVLAGIIVGPLVSAVYALGVALLTTPVGWIIAGMVAIGAATYLLMDNWAAVSTFFVEVWDTITGKFGWARTLIKTLLWPIIGLPGLIIASWGDITDFFGELWGGITSVFQKAWEIIGTIIDNVVGAVETVRDAIDTVANLGKGSGPGWAIEAVNSTRGGGVSAQSSGALDAFRAGMSSTSAKVTVDFANAPAGTRVRTDPQSTGNVDLSVGYQMGTAL